MAQESLPYGFQFEAGVEIGRAESGYFTKFGIAPTLATKIYKGDLVTRGTDGRIVPVANPAAPGEALVGIYQGWDAIPGEGNFGPSFGSNWEGPMTTVGPIKARVATNVRDYWQLQLNAPIVLGDLGMWISLTNPTPRGARRGSLVAGNVSTKQAGSDATHIAQIVDFVGTGGPDNGVGSPFPDVIVALRQENFVRR